MRCGINVFVTLVLAACGMPVGAMAATPANDDFADREVLEGDLPLTATGSNLEATKELGEPPLGGPGVFASGHSVWYEWKATISGFVTVDTCGGSSMRAEISVFTGTALNALSEVAGNFASEGPDCPGQDFFGEAVTFKAVEGITYEIGIDGSSPFPAEAYPGQGGLELEILETPVPINDDFSDATVLVGRELWNGTYAAGSSGFTWNATKEPGEPAHAGDPGGASVWYSWTAPFSRNFHVGACGNFERSLLGIYTGDAVGALSQVASDGHSCNYLYFNAVQGTNYHLAIDGRYEPGSGGPLMGSVSITVSWTRPEVKFEEGPAAQPWSPRHRVVRTKVVRRKVDAGERSAKFWFSANQPRTRFLCKLDTSDFKRCRSPRVYKHLRPGRHAFRVSGVDLASAVGPATLVRFKIPRATRASAER